MKKALDWLLKSSADPARLSLTVKSGVPLLVAVLTLLKVDAVQESDLLTAVDAGIALLAGVGTLVGLVRKVVLTLKKA